MLARMTTKDHCTLVTFTKISSTEGAPGWYEGAGDGLFRVQSAPQTC
jgi:hypothetical protein